jgi:hypothetical protein
MSLGADRFGFGFGDRSRRGAIVFVDAVLVVEASRWGGRPPVRVAGQSHDRGDEEHPHERELERRRFRRHSYPVHCQASQPPRSGQALLDCTWTAVRRAAPSPRRCTMTSRLTTVSVADGKRARKDQMRPYATSGLDAHKALPLSGAAERDIDSVHTQDRRVPPRATDATPNPPKRQDEASQR